MIDLPPLQSTARPSDTAEQLAATCAEMLAHMYCFAGTELAKQPANEQGEELLNKLFEMVGDLDDIAKQTSGEMVRELLGDTSQ